MNGYIQTMKKKIIMLISMNVMLRKTNEVYLYGFSKCRSILKFS